MLFIICLEYHLNSKKTIVFCGIDGLLMFSTQASIVKTCDRSVKIRKDGIKRNVRNFFLYPFSIKYFSALTFTLSSRP